MFATSSRKNDFCIIVFFNCLSEGIYPKKPKFPWESVKKMPVKVLRALNVTSKNSKVCVLISFLCMQIAESPEIQTKKHRQMRDRK